mgnify:CR=1 FL=1
MQSAAFLLPRASSDRIYSSKEGLDLSEFDFKDLIHPNECFVLKSDRNSVLARYNPFTHSICRVMKGKNYGIERRTKFCF